MNWLILIMAAAKGPSSGGRKRLSPVLAALFGVVALAAPPASEPVRLALDHDRLTAGDLASVLPGWGEVEPGEVIAYAPLPGVERRVGASRLIGWGRRFGVNPEREELPHVLLISRRMRTLGAAEAELHLRDALAARYGVTPQAVEVRLDGFEEPRVPTGELTFGIAGSFPRLNRPTAVGLRWREAGARGGTVWLRALISVVGRYAVARKKLEVKVPLRPGDFEFREGPLPGKPERFLISDQSLQGKSLKYPLNQGDALPADWLTKNRAVRRGDLLELQLRSGLILLRVPGRAEEAAAVGEVISCRNLESGSRVMARVLDSKHAEVEWVQ